MFCGSGKRTCGHGLLGDGDLRQYHALQTAVRTADVRNDQPARQYYQSVRENARLEAEYAVLAERNAALTERNESLSSDAGIEQTAHEEYGWVKKGEQTATVEGLSGDYVAKSEGSTVRESIPSGSVEAPATWYSPVLDFVFGVE